MLAHPEQPTTVRADLRPAERTDLATSRQAPNRPVVDRWRMSDRGDRTWTGTEADRSCSKGRGRTHRIQLFKAYRCKSIFYRVKTKKCDFSEDTAHRLLFKLRVVVVKILEALSEARGRRHFLRTLLRWKWRYRRMSQDVLSIDPPLETPLEEQWMSSGYPLESFLRTVARVFLMPAR